MEVKSLLRENWIFHGRENVQRDSIISSARECSLVLCSFSVSRGNFEWQTATACFFDRENFRQITCTGEHQVIPLEKKKKIGTKCRIPPKIYVIREKAFQIKFGLFRGVHDDHPVCLCEGVFEVFRGDLCFLKWNYSYIFVYAIRCSFSSSTEDY